MATQALTMPELVRAVGDGPPLVLPYPEAASQGFKKGAALKLVSGAVSLAATTDAIHGFAAQDASGVTGTAVLVNVAAATAIYAIPLNAATGTSIVGKNYNFVTSTSAGVLSVSSYGAIVLSATLAVTGSAGTLGSAIPFTVIGLDPRDVVGDTNARCHVVVRYMQNGFLNGNS